MCCTISTYAQHGITQILLSAHKKCIFSRSPVGIYEINAGFAFRLCFTSETSIETRSKGHIWKLSGDIRGTQVGRQYTDSSEGMEYTTDVESL